MKSNIRGDLVFVLAGDSNYVTPVETTIKSILYHHTNCKIYVLNEDILPEWFRKVNDLAKALNSEVLDIKLFAVNLDFKTAHGHISKIAYARYFIPQFIPEDKVLYLDSDVIVNKSLTELFEIDLETYDFAGVRDLWTQFNSEGDYFEYNTGVLLVNNREWRRKHLTEQFLNKTKELLDNLDSIKGFNFNGDQTVINLVCKDNILEIDRRFNTQLATDRQAYLCGWTNTDLDVLNPIIIHYSSPEKPWKSNLSIRFKDIWWQYNALDYSEIILDCYKNLPTRDVKMLNLFTVTNSEHLESAPYLIEKLPNCTFHIAAYTECGLELKKLQKYPNVRLHQRILPQEVDKILDFCDVYLDINYFGVAGDILEKVHKRNITMIKFDTIDNGEYGQLVISREHPEKMVEEINMINSQI